MTKRKKRHKCTATEYCDWLTERCVEVGKVGFNIVTYIDMKKGKVTLRLALHRIDKADKGGMALNFCPGCGFNFSKRKDWRGPK